MPNGGPDNCSTCGFNLRNRGVWKNPSPDESQPPFCEIRNLPVFIEHWTYCRNWHARTPTPIGPVYASGIYDGGYRRIPWHGAVQPELGAAGRCSQCGLPVQDGISLPAVESAPLVFCSNQHYLKWWRQQHPAEDAPMSGEY